MTINRFLFVVSGGAFAGHHARALRPCGAAQCRVVSAVIRCSHAPIAASAANRCLAKRSKPSTTPEPSRHIGVTAVLRQHVMHEMWLASGLSGVGSS